ncbi:hypothetical protein Hanom_Chr03g00193781 [Helianthus anomalus]
MKLEEQAEGIRENVTLIQGNPVVDSKIVNFKDLLEVIPTSEELYSKKFVDKNYVPNMEKRISEVMLASLKKKEENVEMMVEELKKTEKEASEEIEQKDDELKEMTEEAGVPKTEVKIQVESFESSNNDKINEKSDEQCRKCVETCSACTEKDENLRS